MRFLIITIMFLLPFSASAVAIGSSKIIIDDDVVQGKLYKLHPLKVMNNSDIRAKFEVDIQLGNLEGYQHCDPDWFKIMGKSFWLDPHASKDIKVNLLVKPKSKATGDFFCLLVASQTETEVGKSQVIGAVGQKIFFNTTGKKANWFNYGSAKLMASINQISKDNYIIFLILLVGAIVITFFSKFKISKKK